ncbi:MAG: hypothetical protein BM562_09125 [Alphaproteobacteria bacterium MedPE-SWcel]|nr:MAG: hypothetical protein BM562_09125 [Alphaproteobacteria bacterium MedPE-SWcel]
MTSERARRFVGPHRGQLLFVLTFLTLSVLLMSVIGQQTAWVQKTAVFAQPRFWPAVAVAGMVVLSALHLWRLPFRRIGRADLREVLKWAQALEYALWFMAYVLLVPLIGYLPVTLVFVPALARRMGYRSRRMRMIAVIFAGATVVLFKAVLAVRIPGAALYEFLPDAWRSFAILYL